MGVPELTLVVQIVSAASSEVGLVKGIAFAVDLI